jgi:uncharacterized protein YndB with AHSA1/START domain
MKMTVQTVVKAKLNKVWDVWNNPTDLMQWNTAQDDWHTTRSTVDLREGGRFLSQVPPYLVLLHVLYVEA